MVDCWRLIRQLISETLYGEPLTQSYGESILGRVTRWADARSPEPSVAHLSIFSCQAAGGVLEGALPVTAAWQVLHIAAKLFDDVEDGDADDPAADVNIASALLSLVPLLLERLVEHDLPLAQIQRLTHGAHRAVMLASAGQHADLLAGSRDAAEVDPDRWLAIARAKSGALLAWAAWAGASVAGAQGAALDRYYAYGEYLGVLLQIADDFVGIWQPERASDLTTRRLSLPVCYALSVAPPHERAALRELLERSTGQAANNQAAARQRLIDLGAQAYMVVIARIYQQHALEALRSIDPVGSTTGQLGALVEQVFPALEHLKHT
ncbi:MAG TPA: polyprenyl synthetase family protein [Herpetosiphonaceae bacterium]